MEDNKKNKNHGKRVKFLLSIVEHGNGEEVTKIINDFGLSMNFEALGDGTAKSNLLSYFGLGSSKKDVVMSLIPDMIEHKILNQIASDLKLYLPGNGISFTIPLASISSVVSNTILSSTVKKEDIQKGEKNMEGKYVLIVCSVKQNFTDNVVEAARAAGATGGTILNARGIGNDKAEHFLGIIVNEAVDVVLIVSLSLDKMRIMEAIKEVAGITTSGNGVIFSLPIDELVGIGRFEQKVE